MNNYMGEKTILDKYIGDVAASASRRLNIGDYQHIDFFASFNKKDVSEEDRVEVFNLLEKEALVTTKKLYNQAKEALNIK